jgi:hypothetical protein
MSRGWKSLGMMRRLLYYGNLLDQDWELEVSEFTHMYFNLSSLLHKTDNL